MNNITYDDWSQGNPIPIECLTEQDIEDIKKMIDEMNNEERITDEQKTSKYSENLED